MYSRSWNKPLTEPRISERQNTALLHCLSWLSYPRTQVPQAPPKLISNTVNDIGQYLTTLLLENIQYSKSSVTSYSEFRGLLFCLLLLLLLLLLKSYTLSPWWKWGGWIGTPAYIIRSWPRWLHTLLLHCCVPYQNLLQWHLLNPFPAPAENNKPFKVSQKKHLIKKKNYY